MTISNSTFIYRKVVARCLRDQNSARLWFSTSYKKCDTQFYLKLLNKKILSGLKTNKMVKKNLRFDTKEVKGREVGISQLDNYTPKS